MKQLLMKKKLSNFLAPKKNRRVWNFSFCLYFKDGQKDKVVTQSRDLGFGL
jgi:hypothetical protein